MHVRAPVEPVAIIEGTVIPPSFQSRETFSFEQYVRFLQEMEKPDLYHCELLEGRIYMTPPAGGPHARVQDNVYGPIRSFVRAHRLGTVFGSSAGYRLAEKVVVEPDVAFVSNEKLRSVLPLEEGRFLEVVPDLAVEVVSLSDPEKDLKEKRVIYERYGVREYWIVEPRARRVVFLVHDGKAYGETRIEDLGSGAVESTVLPGFRLALAEIFEGL